MKTCSCYMRKYSIICYSGGFDSSYFIQSLARKQILYKYIIAHYMHNIRPYNIREGTYIMYMFLCFGTTCIVGCNYDSNNKYSVLRNRRYMFIFNLCFINNINDIYICSNYNDFVENLIIRLHLNSSIYGLINLCGYNYFYYYGVKIYVHRPLKYIRRNTIVRSVCPFVDDILNYNIHSIRGYLRTVYNVDKINDFATDIMYISYYVKRSNVKYIKCFNVYIVHTYNEFLTIKNLILNISSHNVINNIDNNTIINFIHNKNSICVSKCTLFFNSKLCVYMIKYNDIYVLKYISYYIVYLNNIVCYKVFGYEIIDVYVTQTKHKHKKYINYVNDYIYMNLIYIVICFKNSKYTIYIDNLDNISDYVSMCNHFVLIKS